jgi:hypothetical protein
MLMKTVLNLYGKAAYKSKLFVHVVLYADDSASLSVVPLLYSISPNIFIFINHNTAAGYDQIEELYTLGARGVCTTLQVIYTDRTHIDTIGFDHYIYQAYVSRGQPAFAVLRMREKNTWGYSYLIQTTELEHMLPGGGYKSPAIDGYLKYLMQCSGLEIYVEDVIVWRQTVQLSETFHTSDAQRENKEILFRNSSEMKRKLLEDCLLIHTHKDYQVLNEDALSKLQVDWLFEPFIGNGPTN